MKTRLFGKTPFTVGDIGFGAWQIGGSWGDVSEADGRAALNAALDAGMTFIDTADVYGDGRSERIIAEVLKSRSGPRPMVATKAGRRLNPHAVEGYNKANLEAASSRITDVDVAQESTQLARWNVLVQSGTAMLSQANQSAQTALKLLQ